MRRAFRAFAATPQASTEARRFVRDLVEKCAGDQPAFRAVAETAALLATEFVSDALAHRAESVHVLASCLEDRVRVEIYTTEQASHVPTGEEPETRDIRTRLLSSLADRWSTAYVGSGQLNWFEVRIATIP